MNPATLMSLAFLFTAPTKSQAAPVSPVEPGVKYTSTHVGDLTGTVVKVQDGSITVKVSELAQTGITRKHIHIQGHTQTVAVPKVGVKKVDVTYPLGQKLVVKTIGGKELDVTAIQPGEAINIHIDSVKITKPGEKSEPRLEVVKVELPNTATTTTPPEPKAKKK